MELNLSQTSSGSMQISTTIPAVVIKIDPNFVTLLTGALRTLQERQGEEGEKPVKEHSRRTSQRKAVVAPRSLWAPRLVNKKRWYYIRGWLSTNIWYSSIIVFVFLTNMPMMLHEASHLIILKLVLSSCF